MPWRTGLTTAGQQTTISESALWQAQNVTAELDGLLGKRPGLSRWGQILKVPNEDATGSTLTFLEPWQGLSNWVSTDNSSGLIDITELAGSIRTTVAPGSSNENYLLTRSGTTISSKWSLRAVLRIVDAPVYDDTTNANTLAIRAKPVSGWFQEFAIFDDGLYYKQASDDKYAKIANTEDISNGGWHVLEIQADATINTGTFDVYLDETQVADGLSELLFSRVAAINDKIVEFRWEVDGDGSSQYSTEIATVQYNDTETDPFIAKPVRAVSDFRYINAGGSTQTVLLAAVGDYVYHDNGLQGGWRVLLQTQYENVSFAPFRRTILIVDYTNNVPSVVWQWDGTNDPVALDDAPNLKFVTEHKQRAWGAGDKENPLRLYFSGDRQPNLWFSPSPDNIEDQVDAAEQAGYIEIPAKKGDEITGVFGDYYGRILAYTRRGVWQVSGDGPASFSLASVSQDVGTENNECITQVGNDIWFLGRYGVQALSATDQFGDIQTAFPSAAISDLWTQNPSAVKTISRSRLKASRLKYNPTLGLVFCAVPLTGQDSPESVFVYNVNTKQWYGPWTIESQAMENIEIGLPLIEVMAHGGTDGQVLYTDQASRVDVAAGYTMLLQSAYLNGRSLNPKLAGYMKTWKKLRLFVLPRGAWDFTVQWRTDNDKAQDAVTVNQNKYNLYVLGDTEGDGTGDFRLTIDPDARLHSREELAVIEVTLDSRGYALRFTIEQSGAGEDLVIQGFEVEFQPDGYEEE